jgi:hypothetical protein
VGDKVWLKALKVGDKVVVSPGWSGSRYVTEIKEINEKRHFGIQGGRSSRLTWFSRTGREIGGRSGYPTHLEEFDQKQRDEFYRRELTSKMDKAMRQWEFFPIFVLEQIAALLQVSEAAKAKGEADE